MQEPNTSPLCAHVLQELFLCFFDETLPIINKPKHPKKWGIQGRKWNDPNIQEDKRTT
jgi:hypothetical protein